MIIRRRNWSFRLAGQEFAQTISFETPLTAQKAKEMLFRTFGLQPVEIWDHQANEKLPPRSFERR